MTQLPPPYGPQPAAPRPQKPRPSAWWFAVGIGLILGAIAAGVGLFVWTLGSFMHTEVTVAADGRPHPVEVGTDGERMLWTDESVVAPRCEIVDQSTHDPVRLRPADGTFRRDNASPGDWIGSWRFDPGSGHLDVTCTGSFEGEEIQIGAAPRVASFVVGLVATILVPLALGLAGVATLLVTGILWSLRPAHVPETPRTS